jgi:hypothetical protein
VEIIDNVLSVQKAFDQRYISRIICDHNFLVFDILGLWFRRKFPDQINIAIGADRKALAIFGSTFWAEHGNSISYLSFSDWIGESGLFNLPHFCTSALSFLPCPGTDPSVLLGHDLQPFEFEVALRADVDVNKRTMCAIE